MKIKFTQIFQTRNGAGVDVIDFIGLEVEPLETLREVEKFRFDYFEIVVAERETLEL
jgi:hypothetical protein